ncbi:MAG: hypothetical protein WA705_01025 [Candidatus Ozemobacteraceae bacterium]
MIRSTFLIALLAVTISSGAVFAGTPVPGYGDSNTNPGQCPTNQGNTNSGNSGGWQINPNDQVMITLLTMVYSDLDMCRALMKTNYAENILSIGHLNNAQSALRRTDLDPAYAPLLRELLDRLGKIKFYLVMNDLPNVSMRLYQLQMVIRSLISAQGGQVAPMTGGYNGGYNNGGYNNGGYNGGYPQNGGNSFPQSRPTEIPVGGMNITPPGAPSVGVPVN